MSHREQLKGIFPENADFLCVHFDASVPFLNFYPLFLYINLEFTIAWKKHVYKQTFVKIKQNHA